MGRFWPLSQSTVSFPTPQGFKNEAIFLPLGWLDGAFRKRFSNPSNLKTLAFFIFAWTENILKTEVFSKDDVTIIMTHDHNDRMTGDCYVFKFSGVMWTENNWCVFRVKPFSNFSAQCAWGPKPKSIATRWHAFFPRSTSALSLEFWLAHDFLYRLWLPLIWTPYL